MLYQTRAFMKASARDQEKNKRRIKGILSRLEELEGDQNNVMKDLQRHLDTRTRSAVGALIKHLNSEDVKNKFCLWDREDIPTEGTWPSLEKSIGRCIEDRARQFIEDWEEREEAFASARNSLVEHFGEKFKSFEKKLMHLEESVVTSQYDAKEQSDPDTFSKHFIPNVPLTIRSKLILGATLPIWLPFSLVAVIVGTPLLGLAAVAQKMQEKGKLKRFQSDPTLILQKKSRQYIENVATEKALMPFVQVQLEDARLCLEQIQARIPELIEADRALYKQLLDETRSRKKIEESYGPLNSECQLIRGKLAMFAIQEILPLDEDVDGLEWQENPKYLLGQGTFAKVYKGRLRGKAWRPEETVALKVFREPLTLNNACSFLAEERNLR